MGASAASRSGALRQGKLYSFAGVVAVGFKSVLYYSYYSLRKTTRASWTPPRSWPTCGVFSRATQLSQRRFRAVCRLCTHTGCLSMILFVRPVWLSKVWCHVAPSLVLYRSRLLVFLLFVRLWTSSRVREFDITGYFWRCSCECLHCRWDSKSRRCSQLARSCRAESAVDVCCRAG